LLPCWQPWLGCWELCAGCPACTHAVTAGNERLISSSAVINLLPLPRPPQVVATELSKPGVAAAKRNFELNGEQRAARAAALSRDLGLLSLLWQDYMTTGIFCMPTALRELSTRPHLPSPPAHPPATPGVTNVFVARMSSEEFTSAWHERRPMKRCAAREKGQADALHFSGPASVGMEVHKHTCKHIGLPSCNHGHPCFLHSGWRAWASSIYIVSNSLPCFDQCLAAFQCAGWRGWTWPP